jgi:hypothetical protein
MFITGAGHPQKQRISRSDRELPNLKRVRSPHLILSNWLSGYTRPPSGLQARLPLGFFTILDGPQVEDSRKLSFLRRPRQDFEIMPKGLGRLCFQHLSW